jgi:prepilin-type N-terminal cleavage/methylation domain-containing protein
MLPRYRFGFTLIELLVVISIIALLISILLPALGAAKDTARNIQCLSNIRQHGTMLEMYGSDNGGRMPPKEILANDGSTWGNSVYLWSGTGGTANIPTTSTSFGLFEARERPLNDYIDAQDGGNAVEVTVCPDDEIGISELTGTSYNSNTNGGGHDNLLNDSDPRVGINRSLIANPSRFVTMSEPGGRIAAYDAGAASYAGLGSPFSNLFWHSNARQWNAVFGDGHAQPINVDTYGQVYGDDFTFDWNQP